MRGFFADWSKLFDSLADLGRAFEASSAEYATSGGPRTANGESQDGEAPEYTREVAVAVDVEEHEDGYSLYMDVPGLQKSDIKVEAQTASAVLCPKAALAAGVQSCPRWRVR